MIYVLATIARINDAVLHCGARFSQNVILYIKLYGFRPKAASRQSSDEPLTDPHSRPQLCVILSLSLET